MYRKNVAAQTVYAQMIDATAGADVTTGVAADVSQDGAASATGTGTLAHIAHGMWAYTPAQAELNATAVGIVFSKAGAISQSVTLRTTVVNPDSATDFGLSRLDVALSVIAAYTDSIESRLPAALVSGRMDSAVGSYPGNTAQTADVAAVLALIGIAGANLTALGDTRLSGLVSVLQSKVVAGSTGSSVTVSGLPAGRNYVSQSLYHFASSEARKIASQVENTGPGTYTFAFVGIAGTPTQPFTSLATDDVVLPTAPSA